VDNLLITQNLLLKPLLSNTDKYQIKKKGGLNRYLCDLSKDQAFSRNLFLIKRLHSQTKPPLKVVSI
jgi:hypothetical protein